MNEFGSEQPAAAGAAPAGDDAYPVRFDVEYPDRQLSRLTTFFRIFTIIPILFLASTISGGSGTTGGDAATTITVGGLGTLFLPVLLMILFRRKYPGWWFDWNLELQRFLARIGVYAALMDDRYPSTDEDQSVRLEIDRPDVEAELNRAMPLVKWLLALPHYVVLFFLFISLIPVVFIAWLAILFTGRYPQGLFGYVEGVMRWFQRVSGYAFLLVTDRYPPFSLR